MACDECERCKSLGYKFCIKCGRNFEEPEPPPHTDNEDLLDERTLHKTVLPSMVAVLIASLLCTICLLVNMGSTIDFLYTYHSSITVYFIGAFKLATLTGTSLQMYFAIIAAIAIASVIVFIYESRVVFKIDQEDYLETARKTPAYWLGLLLGSTIVIELIINFIMGLLGYNPSTPGWIVDMTLPEMVFSFTKAAVWEEVAFRLLFIGVPMTIVAFCYRQKDGLRYLFGGTGVTKLGIALMVISALLFAYAHVDGWGLWKMFPTIVGGLAFGYLYVRFGIHVCIVAHLINDYSTIWANMFGPIGSLMFIAIVLLGIVCIPILVKKTMDGIHRFDSLPKTGFETVQDNNDSNTD
jgi:hypothetical protein